MTDIKETPLQDKFRDALKYLSNFHSISELLRRDTYTCLDLTEKYPEDEMWRRLAVRCSFSMIESLMFNMKQIAYSVATKIDFPLTPDEVDYLREYSINKKGEEKYYTEPFKKDFPRSLKLFAKVFEIDYTFPEGKEWKALLDSLNIRHRITHPKLVDSISVSAEELIQTNESCVWAYNTVFDLLKEMRDQILKRSKEGQKSNGAGIEHTEVE